MSKGIKIAIDRGGTFTDVCATVPGKPDLVFKLLSVDPSNYKDAPTEGIRRVLEYATDSKIAKTEKLNLDLIESIRMGTTVATNALLERKGADVLLITSKGFRDILAIGNQTRPNIFDLTARKLGQLYKHVLEIDERVTIQSFSEGGGDKIKIDISGDSSLVKGTTGDYVKVLKKPDYQVVECELQSIYDGGVKTAALCLLHSYCFPEHELEVAKICQKIGFQVSVSYDLQPMIGMVSRTSSTVADAYLRPIIDDYLKGFASGFEGGLDAFGNKLLFMQSNGGLCQWSKFTGLRAILSGPAGGLVGYAETCYDSRPNNIKATLGFDMGGTSTDVSRYSGSLEHIFESVVSEVSLQTPQLDISTVAAGGGSMLFWRNGMFVVGPESAGAHPGPACYRKGGPLTVTDANLFLGRLLPEYFPNIFGPNENEPLDVDITKKKFIELTETINIEKGEGSKLSPEEVALGFLDVAIETMCRPIRTLTEAKGFNTADHNLSSFGGAGGQCAVSVAKNLGITHVAIHKYSSLLSAHGIALADIAIEKQSPISLVFNESNYSILDEKIAGLKKQAYEDYESQNLSQFSTQLEVFLNMRYVGSDTHLMILKQDGEYNCAKDFVERHNKEFGFTLERNVLVDDVRIRLVVESGDRTVLNPYSEYEKVIESASTKTISQSSSLKAKKIFFQEVGWLDSAVHQLGELPLGSVIEGPAMIIDNTQTLLIEPHSKATILDEHVLVLIEQEERKELSSVVVDPIQTSVFGHRFMSIAEQMGRTLQKTAISTNIKERLDFSCALFDKKGDLVANAPHVPIHLGAMSFAVKAQIERWAGKIKEGDVFVSNHPIAGGSHLPDITVITPVLDKVTGEPIFWAASRGHHADIGGIAAGSMPPNSTSIFQEGASIVTFKLCSEGVFDEAGITKILVEDPAQHEGCSGTRGLADNLSDMKAQVAANFKGIQLLKKLVDQFTYPVIELYMNAILSTAELSVRNLLKFAHSKFGGKPMEAVDYLDDGTAISLKITIDPETGSSIFDFTGSGDQVYGNLNAPKAILYSAVLYVLRALISNDIPLNNGCLTPINVVTRDNSVLNPSADAATVGGNVETTQRVTDVMLKAFEAAAASQGTCNNLTFGCDSNGVSFGYYETICGGSGAGPTWEGQSVVQCHTTNTRITDPETFEKRYPVILREFSINKGSGGAGFHKGGDGVIRDIEFTFPLQVSCLMERRSLAPFGLLGGDEGARGYNYWFRKLEDGKFRKISLGGKCSVPMKVGDRIVVMTPGGGGYGEKDGKHHANGIEYPAANAQPVVSRLSGSVGMRSMMQETN